MKKILAVITLCVAFVLTGCGDDGKLSGIWEGESASGKWIYRYDFTQKNEGYTVKSMEKLKTSNGDFRTSTEFFLKREGNYLVMNKDSKFLEVISDTELKVISTGMIFKKQ